MKSSTNTLDISGAGLDVRSGHLKLGGAGPGGRTIGVTNRYITLDGKPFFAISGEFQFSRNPAEYWEEELLKMKAAGVNTIASYFFWIHHEECKGVFDWSGNRDARRFVGLCARHGLYFIARIGPFVHGECRNGGLPDWLYGQPFETRSNDPRYLACVERLYREIGDQLRGLMFKDGGPVICVQLDNEYGHSSAPWSANGHNSGTGESEWTPKGRYGVAHLKELRRLAIEAGLETPLYTITAWGSPIIEGESLPVYGGYAYPFWTDKPGPSSLYVFRDGQVNPDYPIVMAEMQGGMVCRYDNRPVVPPRSTEAYSLMAIASGCNFLGYFPFHGGSQAIGRVGPTNEYRLPRISWDFQAPIGEYGDVRDACRYLKILHMFLDAFGNDLMSMATVLPEGAAQVSPTDTETLRLAARAKDGSGFLFLNNFQDHVDMRDIEGIRIDLVHNKQRIAVPRQGAFTLRKDVCCILPFNMPVGASRLEYALAQPLTVLRGDGDLRYFFFAPEGMTPEYCFDRSTLSGLSGDAGNIVEENGYVRFTVTPGLGRSFTFSAGGQTVRVTTLTRDEAEHAWMGTGWGRKRLIVSNADIMFIRDGIELRASGESRFDLTIVPRVDTALGAEGGALATDGDAQSTRCVVTVPSTPVELKVEKGWADRFLVRFPDAVFDGVNDAFLRIEYEGDTGTAFIDGQIVADNYCNGTPWVIGLKRFVPRILEHGICLCFRPLRKGVVRNVSSSMAGREKFEGRERLRIGSITATAENAVRLTGG